VARGDRRRGRGAGVSALALDRFTAHAERVARLCHAMAERFSAGGRLLAVGHSGAERSDVRHVTVEFVHPVIVGKRALPALGIAVEGGPLDAQMRLIAEPADLVIAFGSHPETLAAVDVARDRGCLVLDAAMEADDAFEAQELTETLYHVLWELVHVFLEHEGSQAGAGASAFLYPFLESAPTDTEAVVADVRASVVMKAREAEALRAQTLDDNAAVLDAAVADVRARLRAGGRVLALGNGGSATDAMDLVADLRAAGAAALDLTEDTAVLTALANDVGVENVFARQVIAHGRPVDALVALSTSGGSANVIAALAEARRRGLVTIAFVGYYGGRIAAEGLADHVVVMRSEHIPRIQEAQATAYHALVRRGTA
jgi:D-sedoheptulose 7-phosphate isomerase